MTIHEAKRILDECLEQLPEASLRSAFGFPCLFAAGKVFGLYDGDFIVLRFEEELVATLVAQGEGYAFAPRPNIASARSWVKIAHEHVGSPDRLRDLIYLSYRTRVGRS
ncbi:MAG: TfoX/Sxy family protein [Chloroflexi bacterium]|nr:TfoX/Sxy family protein [Chloroflexota bacterium]